MVVPIPVREAMISDVVTEPPDASVLTAVERLRSEDVGSIVVTDDERVVGILTDDDFIDLLLAADVSTDRPISEFMSKPVESIAATTSIVEAAEKLRTRRIDQLPVLEDDRLVGLISVGDLAAFLPQFTLRTVDDQPPGPHRDWTYEYEDAGDAGIGVGDVVRFSKSVSEADVEAFARISGDENPLHLDESFAEGTRFRGRIVHGLLAASLFSAALAHLPGLVIYLSQDVRFLAPVDIGERVRVVCEVIQDLGHDRYRLSTTAYDERDEQVLVGEAVVLIDSPPASEQVRSDSEALSAPTGTE